MTHGENITDPRHTHQGLSMNHMTCGKQQLVNIHKHHAMELANHPFACGRISILCAALEDMGIASEYHGS